MAETTMTPGSYGIHDTFRHGFSSGLENIVAKHPLEVSEKSYFKQKEQREFGASRNAHGLHMPIRLKMERTVASKIQRLPGLASSNLALRTLLDDNTYLGPEDIFNDVSEQMPTIKL